MSSSHFPRSCRVSVGAAECVQIAECLCVPRLSGGERPQNRLPLPEHCLEPAPRISLSQAFCMPHFFCPRSCTKRKIFVKHGNTGENFVWYQIPRSASLAVGDRCLGSGRMCRDSENDGLVLLSRECKHREILGHSGFPARPVANWPGVIPGGKRGSLGHREVTQPSGKSPLKLPAPPQW